MTPSLARGREHGFDVAEGGLAAMDSLLTTAQKAIYVAAGGAPTEKENHRQGTHRHTACYGSPGPGFTAAGLLL